MTDFIEPKIRPLVEALSSWEGIKTFSSCEGHDNGLSGTPFATFECDNSQTIFEISFRLFKTLWKIVLNDKFFGKDGQIHYTLKPVFPRLWSKVSLNELQLQIPQIADLLQIENSKPVEIDNKFPTLKCESCGSEDFRIEDIDLTINLSYHPSLKLPEIWTELDSDFSFICGDCDDQLELEDPKSVLIDLLNKTSDLEGDIAWLY